MKSFMEEWLATKTPADWPGRGLGRMPWMRITADHDMTKAEASIWMRLVGRGVGGEKECQCEGGKK
jgi:hypothetical protein